MPKKTARSTSTKTTKKPAKKVAKKSTKATKKTSPKVTKSSAASSSMWSTPYLAKEQDQFHKEHPNAKNLIATFIVLTVVFLMLYMWPMMK